VKDNLFDNKFTFMDFVKLMLLVVTMFSTWNIIDLITPPVAFAFVRELAAVAMVEGAFLGFEFATSKAKSKQQMQYATIGFFASLGVITLFAGVSGFFEFAGADVLETATGATWAGIAWTVRDVVGVTVILVFVAWICALAAIYRLYALEDPDKKADIARIQLDGEVVTASNEALKHALEKAKPVIAQHRALAQINKQYADELGVDGIKTLSRDVSQHLKETYEGQTPTPVAGTPFETRKYNQDVLQIQGQVSPQAEALLKEKGVAFELMSQPQMVQTITIDAALERYLMEKNGTHYRPPMILVKDGHGNTVALDQDSAEYRQAFEKAVGVPLPTPFGGAAGSRG
jgi:hypothetical protein